MRYRYTKGHAGLSCQACHESIHGLYPVSPDVDQTTYHQAAQLNPDGSHGPLKCAVASNSFSVLHAYAIYRKFHPWRQSSCRTQQHDSR